MVRTATLCALLLTLPLRTPADSRGQPPSFTIQDVPQAANRYGRHAPPPTLTPDAATVLEAEEFQPQQGAWRPEAYGSNYYVSTFANTFLSRWAYLSADAGQNGVARRQVRIAAAGRYLVLARYEAAYRFHTPFEIRIRQRGKLVFRRIYGRRDQRRIWPFRRGLATDIAWPWGANEQIVWEGHDAIATLAEGDAIFELVAVGEPTPQADRHVDCILVTTDERDVQDRIKRAFYLPLDGLLTQAGDLWCQVINHSIGALQVTLPPCIEHSPYWVHPRRWKAKGFTLKAGERSEWIEVGSLLDTLNHSVWRPRFRAVNGPRDYTLRLAVPAGSEKRVVYELRTNRDQLALYMSPAFRYVPMVYPCERALPDLLGYLQRRMQREPLPKGRPQRFVLYALSFAELEHRPAYNEMVRRWHRLFPIVPPRADAPAGYIDVRHVRTDRLAAYCEQLAKDGLAERIRVVSLGDEISLPAPSGDHDDSFRQWLRRQGLRPADVVPGASDWQAIRYLPSPDPKQEPRRYYYVQRYRQRYGIRTIKQRTDILRRHLPKALIGANYSPHQGAPYLGEVYKWIEVFREEGMTLPWSEDYIWQIPVVSPQVNELCLAMFRAALRGKPQRDIHYYVMPHWPGNSPRMWRRLFYSSLGHGMTIGNLFEFRPLPVAYTENYCNLPETYWQVLRACRELSRFEDIILDGHPVPGDVGLWFSTTADIWHDAAPPYAAEKRSLYVALRHLQVPVEVFTDLDSRAQLQQCRVLFVVDRHVHRQDAERLLDWVREGGTLVLGAGAAMRDQFDRPLDLLYRPLGQLPKLTVDDSVPIRYVKQDLAWARPVATVQPQGQGRSFPVYGVVAELPAGDAGQTAATFVDRRDHAAVCNVPLGKGEIWYFGFLPGLASVRPSARREPLTRGGDEHSVAHRMPTAYQASALQLLAAPLKNVRRLVEVDPPVVEPCLVRSKNGAVLILIAWQPDPADAVVTVRMPLPRGRVETATGQRVELHQKGSNALELRLTVDAADAIIFRP